MQEFYYSGINSKGKEAFGSIQAESPAEAKQKAEAKGFRNVKVKNPQGSVDKLSKALARFKPVSLAEMAFTTRQLATMLQSGIGVQPAVEVLLRQPLGPGLKSAWESVHKELNAGTYLSAALQKNKSVFSGLFIGMTRAGEASGTLAENLGRVAEHLESEYALRQRIQAALTYPAVVFVISVMIAIAIVQHILPHFLNTLFKDMGLNLPLPTRILIGITNFFNDPKALGIFTFLLVIGAWMTIQHIKTPAGRRQRDELTLKIPGLRDLNRKLLACRLARSVSTLVNSGLPLAPSLELSSQAVDHALMGDYLKTAVQDLKDGNSFADAMRAIPILPPIFGAFAELGEQTGQIPYLLDRLAMMFDQDVEDALTAFTQLIEPFMVAIMGGFVGFVLVAIFIPLYQILGSF
jgi:type II secretory pathway component PulF